MNILVLNCGSSSIKYQLFDFENRTILAKGVVEKIGLKGSCLKHEIPGEKKVRLEGEVIDHQVGIEYIIGVLTSKAHGCISSMKEIHAVGHRLVHGGERFQESTLIDDEAIENIKWCISLAPLHNPANLRNCFIIIFYNFCRVSCLY